MGNAASTLVTTAASLGVCMVALWTVSLWRRDASIADPFWGAGFLLVAVVAAARQPEGLAPRQWAVLGMVALWGLRLSLHLLRRNRHSGEDPRYQAMRHKHGAAFAWRSLWTVFALQGAILWAVSWPLQAVMQRPGPTGPTAWDLLGGALWAVGFICEAVADAQLAAHRRDPARRGEVLDHGLWRLSRHPNYFGDALVWWGFGCIAQAVQAPWTLVSPVLMTWLLRRVSGVTLLEAGLRRSKPGYAAYVACTPAFVPCWPRRRRG